MDNGRRGTPDFILLVLTFLLVGFGIVMVFSSSSPIASFYQQDALYYTKKQVVFAIVGLVAMFFVMNMRIEKLKKWISPINFTIIIMLVFVLFTEPLNGARSWITLGSFGTLQPSEFAKIGIILYISALICKKGEQFRDFKTGLLPVLVIIAFVSGLILIQPDLGTAAILIFGTLLVVFVGGANLKHLFGILTVSLGVMSLLLFLLTKFETTSTAINIRLSRFTSYQDPWSDQLGSGYQIIQSLYAFGHGGMTGAGFGQSIQKLFYLPFPFNDFIFSIIAEELGFIGSTIFLMTYLLLLWRGLIISIKSTDMFCTLVGTGIVGILAIQALINIGGVTNAIPITGVPLPFISQGGSSMITSLISVGILLSISRENNRLSK
ncbi:putative lipid II flippase FtsW [Chengkuizengella axinellae]|uniref:Probable peptidoglycan glycosyltransferase FtsW n=1 Tax=Chengkuizengella axinellae TaxID=3064388 RepID=A0ABT9IX16_9BACL|nr:putative lipid II flippase FtsW [Chengkuizengella sp. 2205SS18-9]MDP5273330.1 putative lipid II flippase FtsW [Chengkuizengella sp. 2205SS18-9]